MYIITWLPSGETITFNIMSWAVVAFFIKLIVASLDSLKATLCVATKPTPTAAWMEQQLLSIYTQGMQVVRVVDNNFQPTAQHTVNSMTSNYPTIVNICTWTPYTLSQTHVCRYLNKTLAMGWDTYREYYLLNEVLDSDTFPCSQQVKIRTSYWCCFTQYKFKILGTMDK